MQHSTTSVPKKIVLSSRRMALDTRRMVPSSTGLGECLVVLSKRLGERFLHEEKSEMWSLLRLSELTGLAGAWLRSFLRQWEEHGRALLRRKVRVRMDRWYGSPPRRGVLGVLRLKRALLRSDLLLSTRSFLPCSTRKPGRFPRRLRMPSCLRWSGPLSQSLLQGSGHLLLLLRRRTTVVAVPPPPRLQLHRG